MGINEQISNSIILAIDDSENDLQQLDFLLSNEGFTLKTVKNMANWFQETKSCNPDLILLNSEFSGHDGFQMCSKIKQEKVFENTPVIFMSSTIEDTIWEQVYCSGGSDLLSKPLNHAEIKLKVNNHLVFLSCQKELVSGISDNRTDDVDFLKETVKMSNTGGWALDLFCKTLNLTEQAYRILGRSTRTGLTVEDFIKFFYTSERKKLHKAMRATMTDGQPFDFVLRSQGSDDVMKYLRITCNAHWDNDRIIQLSGMIQDTTDLINLEKTNKDNEQKYMNLLSNIPGVVHRFVIDKENQHSFELIGDNCIDILGISSQDLLDDSMNLFNCLNNDDLPWIFEALEKSGKNETPFNEYAMFTKPDGEKIWLHSTSIPYHRSNGDIVWDGIFNDITEKITIQRELEVSRNRYKLAMDIKNEGLWDWDLTTNDVFFDDRYYTLAGYEPNEFPASFDMWREHVHKDDIDNSIKAIQDYLDGIDSVYETEFRFKRKDGTYMWILSRGIAVEWDADGRPTHFVGSHTDIDKRKKAEEKLHHRLEELAMLNSIARNVIQTKNLETLMPHIAIDIWKIIKARELIIGLYDDECEYFKIIGHDDKLEEYSGTLTGIRILVQNNRILNNFLSDSSSVILPDSISSDPLPSGDLSNLKMRKIHSQLCICLKHGDNVLGALFIGSQLENRAFSNEEVNLAETIAYQIAGAVLNARLLERANCEKKKAEEANNAKSMFLAHISHELRTPLNSILGFTQILNRREDTTDDVKETLSIIEKSGEHLLTLINDVLSMSKIESGYVELTISDFNLYAFLEGLQHMFSHKAEESGLKLLFHKSSAVPNYIKSDESKLRQVLVNIIGNAIKFTHEGSVSIHVDAEPADENKGIFLSFSIRDTGEGISREEQDFIFNRFTQSNSGRKAQSGTGLGLPISQQFIKMLGGEITVESEQGKGCVFSFRIESAIVEKKHEETPAFDSIGSKDEKNSDSGELKILIVDDSEINRLLIKQLLIPDGYELLEAEDGEEAVYLWNTWNPDIILMDMQMPVVDGYEATREIRKLEFEDVESGKRKRTAIIAVTASAMEEERNSIQSTGCDDIMIKPVSLDAIKDQIKRYGIYRV